jgi:hypothetical protein
MKNLLTFNDFVNESYLRSLSDLQALYSDIFSVAISLDIKPSQILFNRKGNSFEIEFGSNVKMSTMNDLASELSNKGRDITVKGGKMIINFE